MRRLVASAGGAALTASLLVTPAAAAPPQRFSDHQFGIVCPDLEGPGGTAFLVAIQSDTFGEFADLALWEVGRPRETHNPIWVSLVAETVFTETTITGSFQLVEFEPFQDPPFGDPVGTATMTATLTPVGEPERYSTVEHDGSNNFRVSGEVQHYAVSGTVQLPEGISFDLSGCMGFDDTFTRFDNSPASSISRFESFQLSCSWEAGQTFIGLFASASDFGGFTDVFISTPDADVFGQVVDFSLTFDSYAASFELFALEPGPEPPELSDPIGTAEASATLAPTRGRINEHFAFGPERVHITGQAYTVDGSLSITSEIGDFVLPMNDENCRAGDERQTVHRSPAQGPGGRPLPNDAPEGALPIGVGETVTVRTGGTAEPPEAACLLEDPFGGVFEVPITKTAWWTFEGTGGDVRIDTAGSDFDTVLGVYVDDGAGGLTQVGCADGDESLQASLTIPTEAGETYWVQAGGIFGEAGTLVLSVSQAD